MNVTEQVIELEEAFIAIAAMVGKDAGNINDVVQTIRRQVDLVDIYERAIRQKINITDAVDMHDLAIHLLQVSEPSRLRRLESGLGEFVPKLTEPDINVYSDEHRERMRRVWASYRIDQKVVDTPFSEYVEEFIEYLASRLEELKE